jgi:hypothetical protein
MILERETREGEPGSGEPAFDFNSSRLNVIVVFTTVEGTLAALESAARLAKNLLADIKLVVAEEVYFRYPLDSPPVPTSFLQRLCIALIEGASLNPGEVHFEIYYCRDRLKCLELRLRERSVIVVGAKRRGWARPERRIHAALASQGHDVLLIREYSNSVESRHQFVIHSLIDPPKD